MLAERAFDEREETGRVYYVRENYEKSRRSEILRMKSRGKGTPRVGACSRKLRKQILWQRGQIKGRVIRRTSEDKLGNAFGFRANIILIPVSVEEAVGGTRREGNRGNDGDSGKERSPTGTTLRGRGTERDAKRGE